MSHYSIEYDRDVKTDWRKACIDTLRYVASGVYYRKLIVAMRAAKDIKQANFYCMLAGVEGFPVEALYKRYHT